MNIFLEALPDLLKTERFQQHLIYSKGIHKILIQFTRFKGFIYLLENFSLNLLFKDLN